MFKAVVLSSSLYACEAWKVYTRHAKKLNCFHLNCLRKLLRITWPGKIPDSEVLARAELPSIHTMLKKAQIRRVGHIVRMFDLRLPKRLFYGELTEGKRSQGGQKKRLEDHLKISLKDFDIKPDIWEAQVMDRSSWRSRISKGAISHEENTIAEAQKKREQRTSAATITSFLPADYMCPTCGRSFRARIVVMSHNRTHRVQSSAT